MKMLFHITVFTALLISASGLTACNAQNSEATATSNPAKPKLSEAGLQEIPLTISSSGKIHNFTVEVAATPEQQQRGLMFRTEMAPDKGMVFPFSEERMASFWMKNTVIPLDIIFIRSDGSIESIAANTTPYSLDPVPSGEPVTAVLELDGGRAAQLGIVAGDIVKWQD